MRCFGGRIVVLKGCERELTWGKEGPTNRAWRYLGVERLGRGDGLDVVSCLEGKVPIGTWRNCSRLGTILAKTLESFRVQLPHCKVDEISRKVVYPSISFKFVLLGLTTSLST